MSGLLIWRRRDGLRSPIPGQTQGESVEHDDLICASRQVDDLERRGLERRVLREHVVERLVDVLPEVDLEARSRARPEQRLRRHHSREPGRARLALPVMRDRLGADEVAQAVQAREQTVLDVLVVIEVALVQRADAIEHRAGHRDGRAQWLSAARECACTAGAGRRAARRRCAAWCDCRTPSRRAGPDPSWDRSAWSRRCQPQTRARSGRPSP